MYIGPFWFTWPEIGFVSRPTNRTSVVMSHLGIQFYLVFYNPKQFKINTISSQGLRYLLPAWLPQPFSLPIRNSHIRRWGNVARIEDARKWHGTHPHSAPCILWEFPPLYLWNLLASKYLHPGCRLVLPRISRNSAFWKTTNLFSLRSKL